MHLNLVQCLCIAICCLGVKCQRGWGSNGGYNSGFSNSWSSGFPSGKFGNGGLNQQNGFENNFGNSFDSVKPSKESGSSAGFGEFSYVNSNKRPNEGLFSSGSWKNSNAGYKTMSNGEKESSENYDTWQSDIFNGRPDEKKSSSITNIPSSSNWNTDTSYNAGFSASESGKPSSSLNNNQNLRPENWNSNAFKNNKLYNENNKQKKVSIDTDFEDNSVISSWNSNNKKSPKPTSGLFAGSEKWETTTKKNNKNSQVPKWEPNKSNKPKQPSASNSWNSNFQSNAEIDKIPVSPTNQNYEPKSPSQNTSILDELDKNDWYFGKESDYPKPPFKSTLNIDVSQLWNFDKNKNKVSNQRNRNNRRNRQIERFTTFADRIRCKCVSVDSCKEEDMILTQKDVKYDVRPLEAFRCEDLTQVCCTNPTTKVSSKANFEGKKEILRCGERRVGANLTGKFDVNVAQPGEFPWMLKVENSEDNCSATLVHHKLALTAAHCVAGTLPNEIELTAGVWNSNGEPPQTRKVARIIPHPDFSIQNPRNDIALLVTETPFELTENVNTVCLPITNDKWDSSQCVVAGWRTEEIDGQVVKVLEKGVVNFLPQAECQNIMFVTDLWRNYVLHDSFVCGLEKTGRQSCKENEGSFLICPSKKQSDVYLQIGVVSKGTSCDNFGRPGLFTNVLKFLDWINRNYFELELFDDIDIRSFT